MLKELAVSIYLTLFKLLFSLLKCFPLKNKTTLVATFGGNILFTAKEVEKQTNDSIIILKSPKCSREFEKTSRMRIFSFESKNIVQWVLGIYHLATSRVVFVDNYYGFLAVTNFKDQVKCIQLWHAVGAIKQFGLEDLSITARSETAIKRFHKVYNRFDQVVVGSDRMANIFKSSFGVTDKHLLRTGIPRTDFFFNEFSKSQAKQSIAADYPTINDKKVILYAPTYRDDELDTSELHIQLDKLYKALNEDYILFLRLHPAVRNGFNNKFKNFLYDVSDHPDINEILVATDLLITDYSSIPFEYALLQQPMIFYAYDLDHYAKSRGLWENYESLVPGPIVQTTEELIEVIQTESYDLDRIKAFANEWNEYSNGDSSKSLVKHVYHEETD